MLDMVVPFGGLPGRTVVSPGRLPGYGSFGGPLRGLPGRMVVPSGGLPGCPLRGAAWVFRIYGQCSLTICSVLGYFLWLR